MYLQQNNLTEALSTYEQLRQIEPQNLRLRLRLGLIYLEQKEVGKALETFQAVEMVEPNNADAALLFGSDV